MAIFGGPLFSLLQCPTPLTGPHIPSGERPTSDETTLGRLTVCAFDGQEWSSKGGSPSVRVVELLKGISCFKWWFESQLKPQILPPWNKPRSQYTGVLAQKNHGSQWVKNIKSVTIHICHTLWPEEGEQERDHWNHFCDFLFWLSFQSSINSLYVLFTLRGLGNYLGNWFTLRDRLRVCMSLHLQTWIVCVYIYVR